MLHRLIYVSACAGVLHYYWLVKSDVRKPLMYAAIVAILLAFRLFTSFVKSRRTTAVRANLWTSGRPRQNSNL